MKITSLAAGGDGVARDDNGRVTFVPLTVPGDDVRVRFTKQTKSFARGEIDAIVTPSPERVSPPCKHFLEGCGGCQWQMASRAAQLAAKQDIVANALRRVTTQIEPILAPAPDYGWRRRARFHVEGNRVGLYQRGSNRLLPLATCPQLEPALDRVLREIIARGRHTPLPDGELALLLGHRGEVVVAFEHPWRAAASLVGVEGIVGVLAEDTRYGTSEIAIEPDLIGNPWTFAQASAAGNAALIEVVRRQLGRGPGTLLELFSGAGNFTRGFREDGWTVTPTDGAMLVTPPPGYIQGIAAEVLANLPGPYDAIVMDPPRAGAIESIDGILRHAPKRIVYISCDPATLARDLERLAYRVEHVQPIDLMPQTSHVEVVVTLAR
ncbi:MAG: TRAM domain-containing protein [Kofleriaceae bacterium]